MVSDREVYQQVVDMLNEPSGRVVGLFRTASRLEKCPHPGARVYTQDHVFDCPVCGLVDHDGNFLDKTARVAVSDTVYALVATGPAQPDLEQRMVNALGERA